MGIVEFIVVMLLSLLVASVFFYGFRSRGPLKAFWAFLVVLFLAGWAGRLWINPAGPVLWGYAWIPVFFFVLIVALLIALAPTGDTTKKAGKAARLRTAQTGVPEPEKEAGAAFGILFWILILFFFTAIVVGIFRY